MFSIKRFSCHVFRCNLPEAVSKILYSFWTVFNRQQQQQTQQQQQQQKQETQSKRSYNESLASSANQLSSVATSIFGSLNFSASSFTSIASAATGSNTNNLNNSINQSISSQLSEFACKFSNSKLEDQYIFRAILDIKEEDQKNPTNFLSVPKEKESFKLRKNVEKQIVIQIQQLTGQTLEIERCFGVLMCPGRNVSHKDMQLLQTISMGKSSATHTSNDNSTNISNSYLVSATWSPNEYKQ